MPAPDKLNPLSLYEVIVFPGIHPENINVVFAGSYAMVKPGPV